MKTFFTLLLMLISSCVPLPASGKLDTFSYSIATKSAVIVEVNRSTWDVENWTIVGSGVAVKSRGHKYILTARHVAELLYKVDIDGIRACSFTKSNECIELDSRYISYSTPHRDLIGEDWALFPSEKYPKGIVPAAKRKGFLPTGSEILQIGIPHGTKWISHGRIVGTGSIRGSVYYKVDSFCERGNSGGGLFDSNGRLAGIVVAAKVAPSLMKFPKIVENQCLAVPLANIPVL